MWEYKIAKTNLWFQVYRKEEIDWMFRMDWLWANQKWIKDKNCAKLFYHQEDALSNLTLAKYRWRKDIASKDEENSIDKPEKK